MPPHKILVVEADTLISAMMVDFFSTRNCEVNTVSDGREAFRLAMIGDYDLITVNVKIPEMDGCLVLESITLVKPTVRILLVSAAFDSNDNIETAMAKAYGTIQLPLSQDALVDVVRPLGI